MATSATTRKIKTWWNFRLTSNMKYKTEGESLTIPDQSFTIEEILERFTRGIDPMLTKNPIWEDDVNFDDLPANYNPDLADIDDAKNFIEEVETKKKKVKELKIQQEKDKDKKAE